MRGILSASLLLLAVASACTDEPRQVRLSFDFAVADARQAAAVIEVNLRRGSCDVGRRPVRSVTLTPSGPRAAALSVPLDGDYFLDATARDPQCVSIAWQCVSMSSVGSALSVTLHPIDPFASCEPSACSNGICAPGSAPPVVEAPDAGMESLPPPLDDGRGS